MGNLATNLNSVVFTGAFERADFRRLMAALHHIRQNGFTDAVVDFSGMTRAFTSDMLPFAVHCRGLMHAGFEVILELPTDTRLNRLFLNSNWAYLIDPRSHNASTFDSQNHLPAIIYSNADEQYEAVEKVINLSLRNLNITDRNQLASIEWSINEIADNVMNHAKSAIGGVMQVSARPDGSSIEYVVCDTGLGIPGTLRESHPEFSTDMEALDGAIREGVTRNNTTNMGNGLYGSYRLAHLSGGHFHIFSGYASLTLSQKNGMHVQREPVPFSGTLVVCSIAIANNELLSEALTFRGHRYSPAYSVVDRFDEQEVMTLRLSDETTAFGSRPAAKPIRQKIENLIRTSSVRIIIELGDIALVSSSFADEVFGKVFAGMGPLEFMNRITISGGSQIVRQLIDRAISQRAALGGRQSMGDA